MMRESCFFGIGRYFTNAHLCVKSLRPDAYLLRQLIGLAVLALQPLLHQNAYIVVRHEFVQICNERKDREEAVTTLFSLSLESIRNIGSSFQLLLLMLERASSASLAHSGTVRPWRSASFLNFSYF